MPPTNIKTTSLWVILIDTSGSMGDGFSSQGPSSGFVEKGAWEAKIDAAKDLLIRRLEALRTPDVAVIEFRHDNRLLFAGHASETTRIVSEIRGLSAGGGTDLASALRSVFEVPNITGYEQVKILVISDGLTNPHEAQEAAEALRSKLSAATIGVLLVDQTPNGDETAFSIATNEDVTYAQSYLEMGRAVGRNLADLLRHDLSAVTRLQRSIIREQLAVMELPRLQTLSFKGSASVPLTASSLSTGVIPVLNSLESLQTIADRASGGESQVRIVSISQSSPVEASISGIAKAVEVADEKLTPWKRKHARYMAELEERKLRLEIAKTHAETIKTAEESDVLRSERRKRQAEAENIELKNELLRIEIEEQKIQFEMMQLAREAVRALVADGKINEVDLLASEQKAFAAITQFMKSPYSIELVDDANDNRAEN